MSGDLKRLFEAAARIEISGPAKLGDFRSNRAELPASYPDEIHRAQELCDGLNCESDPLPRVGGRLHQQAAQNELLPDKLQGNLFPLLIAERSVLCFDLCEKMSQGLDWNVSRRQRLQHAGAGSR